MGNQKNRDAIRDYMREHNVNYTTARRALSEGGGAGEKPEAQTPPQPYTVPLGMTSDGTRVDITPAVDAHTLIAGRSGAGKTFMASQIAKTLIEHDDSLTVLSDRPNEYEWLPKKATRWDGSNGLSGARDSLRDAVEEAKRTFPGRAGRRWVIVDGLPDFLHGHVVLPFGQPVERQDSEQRAKEEIAQLIEQIAMEGHLMRLHLVVTVPRAKAEYLSLMPRQMSSIVVMGAISGNDEATLDRHSGGMPPNVDWGWGRLLSPDYGWTVFKADPVR